MPAAYVSRFALSIVAVAALTLTACSSPSDPESSPSGAGDAVVAPPVIATEGVLNVCTALGLGAVPLFYSDENQEPRGVEVEMAQEVAERLGLEYRVVSTAFPSLIPSLQAAQCDVVMGSLFITEEREAVVDFVPYLNSGSILIVAEENRAGVEGFDETICGSQLGVSAGGSAAVAAAARSSECESDGDPAIVITEVDSAATGRQLVLNGQLDAFAGTSADMYYMVDQSEGELEIAGEPFESFVIGAAVDKGNAELQDAVSTVFTEMADDGRYLEILASVGLEDIAYDFAQ